MPTRNDTQIEAQLRVTLSELELINTLRRKNSRRWETLLSRAQTLAWVLGQRDKLDTAPSLTEFRMSRESPTIDEIRQSLQGVLPL